MKVAIQNVVSVARLRGRVAFGSGSPALAGAITSPSRSMAEAVP